MVDTPLRIIVHAGFHKTGTSSAQNALHAHAAALAPRYVVEVLASSPALKRAGLAARDYSAFPTPEYLAGLEAALADWVAGLAVEAGQTLIVSTEDFAGRMPGNRHATGYDHTATIAACIARALEARFGPQMELQFLYATRAAETWLPSIHWQLSKHNMLTLPFPAYVRRYGHAADLSVPIAAVRAAQRWPVVEVALEDIGRRRLGPVEAIYDLVGVPDDLRGALEPVPVANARGEIDLAEVFVALNRTKMPRQLRGRMKQALQDLANEEPN